MVWRGVIVWMLLLGQLAGASLRAQDSPGDADLRCIAIIAVAVSQTKETERAGLVAGMMYFIGRLDSAAPGTDLQSALRRTYTGMDSAIAEAEGKRCSTMLAEKGQLLQNVGAALREKP